MRRAGRSSRPARRIGFFITLPENAIEFLRHLIGNDARLLYPLERGVLQVLKRLEVLEEGLLPPIRPIPHTSSRIEAVIPLPRSSR